MKYKLEIVHDLLVSKDLITWSKSGRIHGYTTILIDRSYGEQDGIFRADGLSQDKYLTCIYFKEDQKTLALEIKKDVFNKNYFTVLSEINTF